MEALICDICGGRLVMGSGGIATCESCGMQHSAERIKEKVQEIKGTVRVDNTHMVANYLEMAVSAKDAGNNSEAESYCNKIIEIEPTNYKAWLIKGEAAAWQSTLQNSRVDEGVAAFIKAIDNCPEEEEENVIEQAKEEIKSLSRAMISLRAERFAKWPDEEEANGFASDISSILGSVINFLTETGAIIPVAEIMGPIATQINQAVVKAYKEVIWPDYSGDPNDPDDRPRKHEFQTFIKRVGYCTNLVEKAIGLCDEDDEEDIQRYENLIFLHQQAIESCSWDYKITDWGTRSWYKDWQLNDEAKANRNKLINEYNSKINEIKAKFAAKKEAEVKERIEQYWNEHAEEKAALEKERGDLQDKISELENEIKQIPGAEEITNVQNVIAQLSAEKDSLGLFKIKEKNAVQEKINAQYVELKKIQDRMGAAEAEIRNKIAPVQLRVDEINKELTKER